MLQSTEFPSELPHGNPLETPLHHDQYPTPTYKHTTVAVITLSQLVQFLINE